MTTSDDAHLHPRPQMRRAEWIDLCGAWGFAHDDADKGLDAGWQNETAPFSRQITVPFPPESELSGINDKDYHPVVWYRRTFTAPDLEGGKLLMHFGAVDYRAEVWVNGQFVTRHEGGHSSFSADVTRALKPSGEQVVVVRAEDLPLDPGQPRGKQDWKQKPHAIWYNRTTGIWQPVWLEAVPAIYIADLHIIPDIASASVRIGVELNADAPEGTMVELTLTGKTGLLARQAVLVVGKGARTDVHIAAFEHGQDRSGLLWSPEHPNLIDLTVELKGQGVADRVESYLGLRKTGIGTRRFLLNDRPYFMRSVLEQGYYPQSHLAAPSAEAIKREVELIKELGFNAVRIHQKVEDPRFLYWCDRLGVLVWGEMANAYAYSPGVVERFTREWLDVVRRDRNHPSIVCWVPLNESWGVGDIALRPDQQAFATALYHLTKALDPSRPVISNDGWEHTVSDIIGVHDYSTSGEHLLERWGDANAVYEAVTGPGPQRPRPIIDAAEWTDQPVMVTEFGGVSYFPSDGSDWFGYGTVTSEDEYLAKLKELFDAIHDSTELAGYCYTQLTDTLQERNGLLDENRKPKLPVEKLRDIIWRPSRAIPVEFLDVARNKAAAASKKD